MFIHYLAIITLCFQVISAATYPGHCHFIQCDPPECFNSIPPGPGECCPTCPPRPLINIPDCSLVRCARPNCLNPVTPPGQCCPVCPPNPPGGECTSVQCPSVSCPNPFPTGPGQCCPKCLEDCRVILCARPNCNNPITPQGRCCPVCPPPSTPSPPIDCRLIQCDPPICSVPLVFIPGSCCPSCPAPPPPLDCEGFECKTPLCSNPTPPGPNQCCPTCPPKILNSTTTSRPTIHPPTLPTIAPPTPPPIVCPPGVPVTACLINPCDVTTCPNFPNAQCVFDNCGGCNARFFIGSREVTNRCRRRPPSCPVRGQIFQECRSCPSTCTTPDLACAAVCIPGCGCPTGQVIDKVNNRCVQPNRCPGAVGQSCPIKGQVFQRCQSCPVTCKNGNQICPAICRPGCGCPAGQVIDEINKKCVPRNRCPNTQDKCSLPRVTGPCRAYFPRYFYNSLTRRCQRFVYGGCRGNANNFNTFEECQNECQKPTSTDDTCSLPSDSGPCEAAITRYFFDGKRCTRFIYGGCRGNANNFRSIQECRRKCPGNEISPIDKCKLPRDPGPCRGSLPRYFYDTQTRQCQLFIYGGCQGNTNNFQTQQECHRECKKGVSSSSELCQLPRNPGPCRAYIPRYFYNSNTKRCERFIYGGCGGNENNFQTQSECQTRCKVDTSPHPPVCSEEYCAGNPNSICTLPVDTPGTVLRRPSHCDITICKACYHFPYTLPHPRLHRRCPQVIPLFNGSTTCAAKPKLLERWGYCIFKAYKRSWVYDRKNEGTFRCWRPPFPYYG